MVIARDQITLSWQLDVQGTVYYYKKQSSTATAPEKPTSYPPTGWTTTEPGYSSGETSTLYVTVCTLYDNGSFEYSDVSVSASFEAAKEAYNKAATAQTTANNAQTTAENANNRAVSRGEQLVTNGNALLGNNTNFSNWTFDGSKANGSPGSFTRTGGYANIGSDDFIPVTPVNRYRLDMDLVSENGLATFYAFLAFYNVDKISITASDHMYRAGTLTTLSQDLKNGDTVVHLTDLTNWDVNTSTRSYQRGFIFWNYKNSFGYEYPENTYSRNHWEDLYTDSAVNKTAKTITLTSAWNKGTIPAGTKVSQSDSGGTYKYIVTNVTVPTTWRQYNGYIEGIDYSGKNNYTKFPPGAAYCKVGFLWNYNSANDQIWITNIALYEDYKTGIQNALTIANGKNKIFYQNSAPITGMSVGDMWFDMDGGNAVYQYTATGWVLRQFGNGAIAAGSITANEIAANAITANKIAANTITGTQIAGTTLSAIFADIGTITAGVLRSSDYSYSSGNYTTAGMIIDLNNKVIRTPKTAILADGSLYATNGNFSGTISAATGNIGGWIIDGATNRIYSPVTIGTKTYRANMQSMGSSTDTGRLAFYVAIDDGSTTTYPFRVNYAGKMWAEDAVISGDITATSGKIGGWEIDNYALHYETIVSGVTTSTNLTYDYIGGRYTNGSSYSGYELAANGWLALYCNNYNAGISIAREFSDQYLTVELEITEDTLSFLNRSPNVSQNYSLSLRGTSGQLELSGSDGNEKFIAPIVKGTTALSVNKTSGSDGRAGFWANSSGNIFLTSPSTTGSYIYFYYYGATSATSNIHESASGRLTASNVLNANAIGSGHKTAYNDGLAGVWLQSGGHIDISNAGSGSIQFHYANAVNPTSRIYESESGVITLSAYLAAKDYAGNLRRMIGTGTTDGNRVAYITSNATILNVNGQHGTTGTTYTNKSLTFNTSDIRLKTNIVDSTVDALGTLNRIKIREFDWTDEREEKHQRIGMVADELEQIDPRMSVGGGYDEDGIMNVKSVDTFYMVGYLVKAVQELSEEVERLKGAA